MSNADRSSTIIDDDQAVRGRDQGDYDAWAANHANLFAALYL